MRTTANTAPKQWANSNGCPLDSQRSTNFGSSISDISARFQQDSASQSLADSIQQRAQEHPSAFREALQQAFGDKTSPSVLDAVASKAAGGNLPMPQSIRFVDAGTLGPHTMGAYSRADGGTIYLDSRLLNASQILEAIFTEELGHHLDAELGGQDATGNEGAIFAHALLQGIPDDSELHALKNEDAGTDGTTASPPREENEDDDPPISVSFTLPGTQDLFERNTLSGGTKQAARADYIYSQNESAFIRQHETNQFAPYENTIRVNGGTSDEFRYNNTDSQTPPNNRSFQVGESVSTTGFAGVELYQDSIGDEGLGATAQINAGVRGTATANVSIDKNGLEANTSVEGFVGVEANAEAHAELGPVTGTLSVEAQAGVHGLAGLGFSIDPRNGLAGQASVALFAGAQVELEAATELGDSIDAAAGVDLKAGIGIEASGDIEFGLESIGMDVEIGAALGLGLDLKIDVSVSPIGIYDDIGDTISAVKRLWE